MNILDTVGRTSLVRLSRIVPPDSAQIWLKAEWENPTGSMKDRMALAVISRAAQRGDLPKGGTIVEYTGGSTGTSLAFVGGALGYRVRIVTSDAFSKEKRDHMTALGAELILVPSDDGKTSKRLILAMIEKARELGNEPGAYLVDQLNNPDTIPGYEGLAAEILDQTEGALGAFVHSVGTSASSRGGRANSQGTLPRRARLCGRTRRIARARRRRSEPAQDRRCRRRIHASALEGRSIRRHRGRFDGGCEGHGTAAGARGVDLCGYLHRRECGRGAARGRAAWGLGDGRHDWL
jgi:hypothetical protein